MCHCGKCYKAIKDTNKEHTKKFETMLTKLRSYKRNSSDGDNCYSSQFHKH